MADMSSEDAKLDVLWRQVFGGPLPMLGAPDIAKAILKEHAETSRPDSDRGQRSSPSE